MEVVLANGDVVRTGMGALPNSRTWQQYKYGFGPYVDGIFTQSNYGIVTKMGVWLYPMPEMRFTGIVSVPKHDDLTPMVDTLSYLMNSNIVQGTTSVASSLRARARDPELIALRSKPAEPAYRSWKNICGARTFPTGASSCRFTVPPK